MHTFNAIDKDRYGLHTNCIDRDTLIFLYVINVMKENTVQVLTDCWPAISLPLALSFIFFSDAKNHDGNRLYRSCLKTRFKNITNTHKYRFGPP